MTLSLYSSATLINQRSAESHCTGRDICNGVAPLIVTSHSPSPSNTSAANDARPRQGGITITFPMKLYAMLREIEDSTSDVICWNEGGDAFVIQKPKDFTAVLLPKYFRTKKFTSFQRQLNAYGFVRGNMYAGQEDMHIYHHEIFHRDHQDRLPSIKRRGPLRLQMAGGSKINRRRTFVRVEAPMAAKTSPDAAMSASTTPTIVTTFEFDEIVADLASDAGPEEAPQQQQQVLPPQRHRSFFQQQQLQQRVQLQQQFRVVSSSSMRDSVLDEAVAAVVSIDDARSLYAGMLNNWNTDEEGLWTDPNH